MTTTPNINGHNYLHRYLDRPAPNPVLCVDEKTQIQALIPHRPDIPDAARHPGARHP